MTTTPTPMSASQVRRPWRATVRTAFQFLLAAAVLLPFIVEASGLDPQVYPWLGGILAVAAAVTRIMALPQVEAFLRRFAPWLAADPDDGPARRARAAAVADRTQRGHVDAALAVLVTCLALLILLATGVISPSC
ncbi:hypothetical protein [Nocardioides pakistanensis]